MLFKHVNIIRTLLIYAALVLVIFCTWTVYHDSTSKQKIDDQHMMVLRDHVKHQENQLNKTVVTSYCLNQTYTTNVSRLINKHAIVSTESILKFYPKSKLKDLPFTIIPDPYYIENSHICTCAKNLDVVFLVSSAPGHFERRKTIRATWGNSSHFNTYNIRTVFFLGQPATTLVQGLIERENNNYGDIVQGKYIDTYINITHKTVLSIRWASEHCPHSRLIVKVDDDVFVNVFKLLRDIEVIFKGKTRTMWCYARVNGTSFIQRAEGKWAIGDDYFKNLTHFPFVHCNGFFVAMTPDLPPTIYELSRQIPIIRLDDVYLTGIIPSLGKNMTVPTNYRNSLSYKRIQSVKCFKKLKKRCTITAATDFDTVQMYTTWRKVKDTWTH